MQLFKKLKKSPLGARPAPGKLEVAALAATLTSFLHHGRPEHEVPTWQMLTEQYEMTKQRAELASHKTALAAIQIGKS